MSHPAELPDLFLDRSLGRIKVPALLRGAGLRLTTLSEHYGVPEDEGVADEDWLELAGSNGWVVFMKTPRSGTTAPNALQSRTTTSAAFACPARVWTVRRWPQGFYATSPESHWPVRSPDPSSMPSTRTASSGCQSVTSSADQAVSRTTDLPRRSHAEA